MSNNSEGNDRFSREQKKILDDLNILKSKVHQIHKVLDSNKSREKLTKFLQNSASLATTLAFWGTAFSFFIGYFIVWKYLSDNGELWLFSKIITDYPFQLFMFGFLFVFLTSLMPFLLGILAGRLTDQFGDKHIIRIHISIYLIIMIFILFLSKLINGYLFIEILSILLILIWFSCYKLIEVKSLKDILCVFAVRAFFY